MWKRISVLWVVVKTDVRRLWFALGHPQSPGWLKAGAAGLAIYLISPIDLIPDLLPVVGILDDLVLVPMALRWLLSRLPEHIRRYADERATGKAAPRSDSPGDKTRRQHLSR